MRIVNLLSTLSNAACSELFFETAAPGPDPPPPNSPAVPAPPNVVKAVPLPPVQHRRGVTVLAPAYHHRFSLIHKIFDALGTTVHCAEAELPVFQTATCLMGPFYQWLALIQERMGRELGAQDRPGEVQKYLVGLFECLLADCKDESFRELMEN